MRLFLKISWKLLTAAMMAWMFWLSFAPATVGERAGLGTDYNRFNLVQMRLARTMMTLAPDLAVSAFSQATDIPADIMKAHLQAKASGQPLLAPQFDAAPPPATAAPLPDIQEPEVTPHRRTEAGGALFVRP